MAETSIAWCDYTFNPWWGCTEVSPACDNCYARVFSHRLGLELWGNEAPRRFFSDAHWNQPRAWNRRAERDGIRYRVFAASMADVLERGTGPNRLDMAAARRRLWSLIEECPALDWLLLSKRWENLDLVPATWLARWPAHVWAGATGEDQRHLEFRSRRLREAPAGVRFLSIEPMLGPVDLTACAWADWAIFGGESGARARGTDVEWIRAGVLQCRALDIAPFVKQIGSRPLNGGTVAGKGDDMAEWPPDLRVREFPA